MSLEDAYHGMKNYIVGLKIKERVRCVMAYSSVKKFVSKFMHSTGSSFLDRLYP